MSSAESFQCAREIYAPEDMCSDPWGNSGYSLMTSIASYALVLLVALAGATGCERSPETAPRPRTVSLAIGQQMFKLDLALDPAGRRKGMGGRRSISSRQGMLLVLPRPIITAVVARDCYVPLDVAFLDAEGQVLSVSTIPPEPPRRAYETNAEYEARLPTYSSHFPVRFVLEVAGGRLADLGVVPGHNFDLSWKALARRAS